MPLTPQITLTATLDDITGAAAGTTANPARIRIALCGFGLRPPQVAGTATLAQIVYDVRSAGGAISVPLWGNDVITPAGTYYAITVYDGNNNVLQCAAYQFAGTQTIDLSAAVPMMIGANALIGAVPNGKMPGDTFVLPVKAYAAGNTLLYYNGVLQDLENYVVSGFGLLLTFQTQPGDTLYLLYSAQQNMEGQQLAPWIAIGNGVPGKSYTLPTAPPSAQFGGLFYNGGLLQPADYTITGQLVELGFATQDGDVIFALYYVGAPAITGFHPVDAVPGTTYTLPTAPKMMLGFYISGIFQRPGIEYTVAGSTITLRTATTAGDYLYAYYV